MSKKKKHKGEKPRGMNERVISLIFKGVEHQTRNDPNSGQPVHMARAETNDSKRTLHLLRSVVPYFGDKGGWKGRLHMGDVFTARVKGGYVLEIGDRSELESHLPQPELQNEPV